MINYAINTKFIEFYFYLSHSYILKKEFLKSMDICLSRREKCKVWWRAPSKWIFGHPFQTISKDIWTMKEYLG